MPQTNPLAVVTGASTGIGYELARCCATHGFDLVVCADEPSILSAAAAFRGFGVKAEAVEADLATAEGVEKLYAALRGRSVDALVANAGHGLGHAFLDQDFARIRHVVDTNITGTMALIHKVGRDMRARKDGRILVVGSIAGYIPGTFQAVYNASKAFLDNFTLALRSELADSNVSVTLLMPGATETEFFRRAEMLDTKVGQSKKADPADVARDGFEAMMRGDAEVVSGWSNKVRVALANLTPGAVLAEQNRRSAEPGSGGARAA